MWDDAAASRGDPGMGLFISPHWEDSALLLTNLASVRSKLSLPMLIGASRKSFLAHMVKCDVGPQHRLGASLAALLCAARQGVEYARIHDVLASRQFLDAAHILL